MKDFVTIFCLFGLGSLVMLMAVVVVIMIVNQLEELKDSRLERRIKESELRKRELIATGRKDEL